MALFDQLTNNPTVKQWQRRWDAMPQRDRQAVMGVSLFFLLVALYLGVWVPVQDNLDRAQADAEAQQELLTWLQSKEAEARAVSGSDQNTRASRIEPEQLLPTVTNSARQQQISVKRFEPKGNDGLRVWMEDVPYQAAVKWLYELDERFGVEITQIAMDKADKPGRINLKITLRV